MFSDLPKRLILDESAETSLESEYLVNEVGDLEVVKEYSGEKLKEDVYLVTHHPSAAGAKDLMLCKHTDLKKIAKDVGAQCVDLRSNVEIRQAIRDATGVGALVRTELPVSKGEATKQLWSALQPYLPVFAIFRADRPSTDRDEEVQDPMQIAIEEALRAVAPKLDEIASEVQRYALGVASRTLDKLSELDASLASTLQPRFTTEPKWSGLFKLSLTGDHDIPINKRGSGVRRLILLSFFQAELERRRVSENFASVIYAIEEPETSQHPNNQRAVVEALKELSDTDGCQVLLTTHVPALTALLPVKSIRHVTQNGALKRSVERGDQILKRIAEDFGVFPDLQDGRVKVFLCVEGPTDIEFMKHLSDVVRKHDARLPDLRNCPEIATIPLGGQTLRDWVNKRYLKELRLPEVHIYDSDKPEYAKSVEDVNARNDKSFATLTNKREIENYLHSTLIATHLKIEVEIDDKVDVEAAIKAALGQKRFRGKMIKRFLAEDVACHLTVQHLKERNALSEVVSWFQRLQSYLP